MSSETTLAAYTPPGGSYPPYINISRENDIVKITVRSHPSVQDGMTWCGETSLIYIDADQARTILKEALDKLNEHKN